MEFITEEKYFQFHLPLTKPPSFVTITAVTRAKGEVTLEPPVYANFVSTFEYLEDCNRKILNYGWVEFPMAYTQVANFSVYIYFLAALFGRQFLQPEEGSQ